MTKRTLIRLTLILIIWATALTFILLIAPRLPGNLPDWIYWAVTLLLASIGTVADLTGLFSSDDKPNAEPSSPTIDQREQHVETQTNIANSQAEAIFTAPVAHVGDSTVNTAGGMSIGGNVHIEDGDLINMPGGTYNKTILQRRDRPDAIPPQLPDKDDVFIGREEEIAWLLEHLQPDQTVTLCGPGGIGKTALAATAIRQLCIEGYPPARFPDGILFHSFYKQTSVDAALLHIALSFGEEEIRPSPAAAAQRSLAGRKALLLLDGAEQAEDLPKLLAIRGQCGIFITTRDRTQAGTHLLDVQPLPSPQAVALVQAWGQDWANDDTAVPEIAELVGWLPLALRLVGSYLSAHQVTAAEFLADLKRSPLQSLDQGDRRLQSVPLLLERSLNVLGDHPRQILAIVGLLAPAAFDRQLIEVVDDDPAVFNALGDLVRYSLLTRNDDGYYSVAHTLIHRYAQDRLSTPPAALERLAEHYTSLFEHQMANRIAGLTRLAPHRVHVLHISKYCVDRSNWPLVIQIVKAVHSYLDMAGYWSDLITLFTQGVLAAQATSDTYHEGAFLNSLGTVYRNLGQHKQAIDSLQQALYIAYRLDDRQAQSSTLGTIGSVYDSVSQIETAIAFYEQALKISIQIENYRSKSAILGNLGIAYRKQRQYEKAITSLSEALVVSKQINDRQHESIWLGNLGTVYGNMGQMNTAIDYINEALFIAQEIGDKRSEGNHLGNLGSAHAALGQVEEAISYCRQALAVAQQIGDQRGEGNHLGHLGRIHAETEDGTLAVEYCQQSLTIKQKTQDRLGEGVALNYLGYAYQVKGEITRAIGLHRQAEQILRDEGQAQPLGHMLIDLAEAFLNAQDLVQATTVAEEALTITQSIDDGMGYALAHRVLGKICEAQARPTVACSHYQEALVAFQNMKSPHAEAVRQRLNELNGT